LVAAADTVGKTPLEERVTGIVTRYSRAEYMKYKSEKRGILYLFGKKPAVEGEGDYRWSLRFFPASSFSAAFQGTFRRSILRAKFTRDKLPMGFVSQRLNDFVRGAFRLKEATVTLSGN
jgi:hypothetical protein